MVADLLALKRVPVHFFGVYMSVNPVFAALIGLIVLRQSLRPADWVAIGAIVTANAISVRTAGRSARACAQPHSGGLLARRAESGVHLTRRSMVR